MKIKINDDFYLENDGQAIMLVHITHGINTTTKKPGTKKHRSWHSTLAGAYAAAISKGLLASDAQSFADAVEVTEKLHQDFINATPTKNPTPN